MPAADGIIEVLNIALSIAFLCIIAVLVEGVRLRSRR